MREGKKYVCCPKKDTQLSRSSLHPFITTPIQKIERNSPSPPPPRKKTTYCQCFGELFFLLVENCVILNLKYPPSLEVPIPRGSFLTQLAFAVHYQVPKVPHVGQTPFSLGKRNPILVRKMLRKGSLLSLSLFPDNSGPLTRATVPAIAALGLGLSILLILLCLMFR